MRCVRRIGGGTCMAAVLATTFCLQITLSATHFNNPKCPDDYFAPSQSHIESQIEHWQEETWASSSQKDKVCSTFRKLCIDQGNFLYQHEDGRLPPTFDLSTSQQNLRRGWVTESIEVGEGRLPQDTRVPDPVFRPLTSQETSPDLNQPIYYSNCTVPVVWYASYLHNFAEVFEGFFLPIWAARKKKAWDTRYSFFFSTRRITPHLSLLSKVHSQFEATTLSAASARIGSSLHSNSTAERVHVRCFEALVMCKVPSEWHWMGRPDLNTGYWDLNIGFERPNWDAAQDFLNATRKMGRLPVIDLSSLPKSINTTSRDHARTKAAARSSGRRLRVVIARRPLSPRRSILNIDAVMDWCNSWRPTNQSSMFIGAECVWYAFDDLSLSAALMEQTDVFISVHGAASTNAVFMPLGSSAIEIRPLDFQGTWPNHYLRKMLTITDHNSSVFWYGLNVKNPLNSAKGKEEQLRVPDRTWTWLRDRHVRLNTSMLGRLFDEIAHVDGDAKRYQTIASQGRHYIDDLGNPATDWVDHELSNYVRRRRGEDKNATGCPNEYNIQTIKCPR